MKINDVNTKSFLGSAGAAENSYILINYEDNNTNEPVTYKTTVEELGKAIASKLSLAQIDPTHKISCYQATPQNTYTQNLEHPLVTTEHYNFLYDLMENPPWASIGDIEGVSLQLDLSQPQIVDTSEQQNVYGKIPVIVNFDTEGLYTVGSSGLTSFNLASPFMLPENDASITWGKNIFVANDDEHENQFYVMGNSGPEEISLVNSVPLSFEETYNTLSEKYVNVKLPFVPINNNADSVLNGIYVANVPAPGYGVQYIPLEIEDNLKATIIGYNGGTLHPIVGDELSKELYYYDASGETWKLFNSN